MAESTEVMILPDAVIKQFAAMVTVIEDYEPGDGSQIIEQILSAKGLGDLDAPWKGGRKAPIGRPLWITGIKKAPSDFVGGLPFFLVLTCVAPNSGEVTEYTAGGTSIVAQLVRAHTLGEFPIAGTIIEVESKRNPGSKPQHFEVSAEDTAYLRETLAANAKKK